MTPEQIIAMAMQAGMNKLPGKWDGWSCHLDELQAFAQRVRNDALEEAALMLRHEGDKQPARWSRAYFRGPNQEPEIMTKITVDKALIEQAIGALEMGIRFGETGLGRPPEQYAPPAIDALRAALTEPAVDRVHPRHPVVVYWRNDGIEACAGIADAYGNFNAAQDMRAMITASPRAPTEVPLTHEEISLLAHNIDPGNWIDLRFKRSWHDGFEKGARAIEKLLRQNARLK